MGILLFAGGRALAQGVWLSSQAGAIGSVWIGTEQVSSQEQAKVDSNRLAERDGTAADILDLSEVGSLSIIRNDQKCFTRMGEFQFRQIIVITNAKTPHGMAKPIMATVARTGPTTQTGIQ